MTDTPTEREAESTWARLRRRKVVPWGLVYVAGAWGFLQGLEYLSESFNWPQQVRQIAVLALVIGLPIVLVLAWYHGDRGEQRFRAPRSPSSRCCYCWAVPSSGSMSGRPRQLQV